MGHAVAGDSRKRNVISRFAAKIQARDELPLDSAWASDREFYTPAALGELLERENRNALDTLVAQLRSPMGVIAFVGAGMPVEFVFPGWPKVFSPGVSR